MPYITKCLSLNPETGKPWKDEDLDDYIPVFSTTEIQQTCQQPWREVTLPYNPYQGPVRIRGNGYIIYTASAESGWRVVDFQWTPEGETYTVSDIYEEARAAPVVDVLVTRQAGFRVQG